MNRFKIWREAASKKEPVNLGTGRATKTKTLVEMLLHHARSGLEPIHVGIPYPINFGVIANTSRARALGFNPQVAFEEGLEKYVRWAVEARQITQPKTF